MYYVKLQGSPLNPERDHGFTDHLRAYKHMCDMYEQTGHPLEVVHVERILSTDGRRIYGPKGK